MSSDEATDDAQDPEQVKFIIMPAAETFDSQERVFSRAAYDLHILATAHSASCGYPGFVPDDYLEHLDRLGVETTITAAELCAIGSWERIDGGYRVLDWEMVEVARDHVREIRSEDSRALAWEQERDPNVQAQMAKPVVVTPPCAECGNPSTRIELVAPGQLPAEWEQWPSTVQESIARRRRILRGLRRCLLLPALARVGDRLWLLSPQPRQKPRSALGPGLVTISIRTIGSDVNEGRSRG